jgi:hypothetical protein
MRYSVRWKTNAEQQLAQIWLDAGDRAAITSAASRIDLRLERNPKDEGESRANARRILFEPPLGVRYRVIEDDLRVEVLEIWRFDGPSG